LAYRLAAFTGVVLGTEKIGGRSDRSTGDELKPSRSGPKPSGGEAS
jgi:hypothetical protein